MPKTKEIDDAVRRCFRAFKKEKYFLHTTGHSLGFASPHGEYFRFSQADKHRLRANIPFTIEPGLYFEGEYGARSEIDGYVTEDYELILTSRIQKEITFCKTS